MRISLVTSFSNMGHHTGASELDSFWDRWNWTVWAEWSRSGHPDLQISHPAISFCWDLCPLFLGTWMSWKRITEVVATIDNAMLGRVWQEFDYRLDVCRVTSGAHIDHLWTFLVKIEITSFLNLSDKFLYFLFPRYLVSKCAQDFWNILYL